MHWESLIETAADERVMPWLGGRDVGLLARRFRVRGELPELYDWYCFEVMGRRARVRSRAERPLDLAEHVGEEALVSGYLVGDRLVPDVARVVTDVAALFAETRRVHLVPPGTPRFARVRAAAIDHSGGLHAAVGDVAADDLLFVDEVFPIGPELDLEAALDEVALVLEAAAPPLSPAAAAERARSALGGISGVTPAMHLCFVAQVWHRALDAQQRAWLARHPARDPAQAIASLAEAEAEAQANRRRERWERAVADGAARRELAAHDLEGAARAALAVSGARLVELRDTARAEEVCVRFYFAGQAFECTCERTTLRIVDAGICLEDHFTGERGDTRFTLESLPAVIEAARRRHRLVVWRAG